jgi:hypothetical protein
MIYNFKYVKRHDRTEVIEYLSEKNFTRVIDLGACAASWSTSYITHYADVQRHSNSNLHGFVGSICTFNVWEEILKDVEQHGKYDFVICSHTLEDISSPQLVCEMMPKIANEGFIAVPCKYSELKKHEGSYYGYIHHRWIFNKEGNEFVAYPKLNFIEYSDITNKLFTGRDVEDSLEISFFWKDTFKMKVINGDYMGPNISSVIGYFNGLCTD